MGINTINTFAFHYSVTDNYDYALKHEPSNLSLLLGYIREAVLVPNKYYEISAENCQAKT